MLSMTWLKFPLFFFYFQYSVWNVLWLGWNTFLICFYLNVGILDRVSIRTFFSDRQSTWHDREAKSSKCFSALMLEKFLTRKKIHSECDENGKIGKNHSLNSEIFGSLMWLRVLRSASPRVMQLCCRHSFYFHSCQLRRSRENKNISSSDTFRFALLRVTYSMPWLFK